MHLPLRSPLTRLGSPRRHQHSWLLGILAAFTALVAGLAVSAPATAAAGTTTLYAGEQLTGGQALVNGPMTFNMGNDGNLVLSDNGHAVWANGKSGHNGAYLKMQPDGNLVEYSGSTAIWSTGTDNHPGNYLSLSSVGVTSVTNGGTTFWRTPYPNTYLDSNQQDVKFGGQTMSEYGGPILYDVTYTYSLKEYEGLLELSKNGSVVWYGGSFCPGTYHYAEMQPDGTLVTYCNNQPSWASGTGGHPASYGYWLHLQSDGNLVIYSNFGQAEWSTGTH